MLHSQNTIAIPPGETIKEQLEVHQLSQKEFAMRMGMSEKHMSHLINGKVELTHETALKLEYVLGPEADFWNRLEDRYRTDLIKVKQELMNESELKMLEKFQYGRLAKIAWLPEEKNVQNQIINLRKFFKVSNLAIIKKLNLPGIDPNNGVKNDYQIAIIAQKYQNDARLKQHDIKQLLSKINYPKSLVVLEKYGVQLKD